MAIYIFSLHKRGHCSILYINEGIEINPMVKGGQVQFSLINTMRIQVSNNIVSDILFK